MLAHTPSCLRGSLHNSSTANTSQCICLQERRITKYIYTNTSLYVGYISQAMSTRTQRPSEDMPTQRHHHYSIRLDGGRESSGADDEDDCCSNGFRQSMLGYGPVSEEGAGVDGTKVIREITTAWQDILISSVYTHTHTHTHLSQYGRGVGSVEGGSGEGWSLVERAPPVGHWQRGLRRPRVRAINRSVTLLTGLPSVNTHTHTHTHIIYTTHTHRE